MTCKNLYGAGGVCDRNDGIIKIQQRDPDDADAMLIIIHEMCHAFGVRHAKPWQTRMLKAAADARRFGMIDLAKRLTDEVHDYQQTPLLTAGGIYEIMGDAVIDAPDISFLQVVDHARSFVAASRREFLRTYKRARQVFDERKRYRQQQEQRCRKIAILRGAESRARDDQAGIR